MRQDLGVFLALREAASRLRVRGATVKHWIRSGKLRARRFGGALYVPVADIVALQRRLAA